MSQRQLLLPMDLRVKMLTRCEPIKASSIIKYYISLLISHSIGVYDLGGGTFDISILEMQKGVFEVQYVT